MKSPTSPIRLRNAIGVMLAMSAIFAITISTIISVPNDDATADHEDELTAEEARAKSWWNSLNDDQKVAALYGEVQTDGNYVYVGPTGGGSTAVTPAEAAKAKRMFESAHQEAGTLNAQGTVEVDGLGTPVPDADLDTLNTRILETANALYPINGISGFQSVGAWWEQLDCRLMRVAAGDGNVADTSSDFCAHYPGSTPAKKLNSEAQQQVDTVGKALLGLASAGTYSEANTNDKAEAWWDMLNNCEMVNALYGADAFATTCIPGDPTDPEDPPTRTDKAQKMYDALDGPTRGLVNDRWQWIYNMGGGTNPMKAPVIYWWDSIGCTERRIAVGVDNGEPSGFDSETPQPAEYCAKWDGLNPSPGETNGVDRQARVLEVGQAILGIQNPVPQVAAWWNSLDDRNPNNGDERINVVYGSPLAMEDDSNSGTTPLKQKPVALDTDRKAFQKPYDMLDSGVIFSDLPLATIDLLGLTSAPGFNVDSDDTANTDVNHDNDTETPDVNEADLISTKAIVDAIANEIFDPPAQLPPTTRVTISGTTRSLVDDNGDPVPGEGDDNEFDWPYNSMNKPASVADWWEQTDCRVMRLAVGEDNDYLHTEIAAVEDTDLDDGDQSRDLITEESSIYCAHFPDNPDGSSTLLTPDAQEKVVKVGAALLGLTPEPGLTEEAKKLHAGRPSFNNVASGAPTISGTAQVGSTVKANPGSISDTGDGTNELTGVTIHYSWHHVDDDGDPIDPAIHMGESYTLMPGDAGKTIVLVAEFTDNEGYHETIDTSDMMDHSDPLTIAGSPGEISKIEPGIRGVVISPGGKVKLTVRVYGLQGVEDAKLANVNEDDKVGKRVTWESTDGSANGKEGVEIEYEAPSSPGTYTITASVGDGDCQPKDEEKRDDDCKAKFEVQVQRSSTVPEDKHPAPENPPGEIPAILTDSDGNQYEVFTPEGGGTFTGEGFNLTAGAGVIPNGEFIGVRVEDAGAASNMGMTEHRYTLGGNMYTVSAVDATGAAITSYELWSPATVCVPLPDELRHNISSLSLTAINSDGSLTILSASVRLGSGGTHVCGSLSSLPASVAVGSAGAPAPLPTPVPPTATAVPPETGGASPSSSGMALWALLLGASVVTFGTFLLLGSRRRRTRQESN